MMVERKLEEKIFINEIVGKYLRNKHILLEYLARKEENELIEKKICGKEPK